MTITYNIEMIKKRRRVPQDDLNARVEAADLSLGAQPCRAGPQAPHSPVPHPRWIWGSLSLLLPSGTITELTSPFWPGLSRHNSTCP